MAANCLKAPTANTLDGDGGVTVTAMEDNVGLTVRVTAGLVTPERLAVISVVPTATPVATPEDIVTITIA